MKSYIVRIYRENRENPCNLVGVVEEAGKDGKKAFTNIDELCSLLNSRGIKGCRVHGLQSPGKKKKEG